MSYESDRPRSTQAGMRRVSLYENPLARGSPVYVNTSGTMRGMFLAGLTIAFKNHYNVIYIVDATRAELRSKRCDNWYVQC